MQEAQQEVEVGGGKESGDGGKGEYDNVDFLDGVSDKLAELVLGGAPLPKLDLVAESDCFLDSEAFDFGAIMGEAEC